MEKKYAPAWSVKPFAEMIKKIEKLYDMTIIMRYGFNITMHLPEISKVIKKIIKDEEINYELIKKMSEKAEEENNSGFPFIYSNLTILTWSYLESAISQFIFNLLKNESKFMKIEEIKKIKISVAVYCSLTDEEKIYYLVEQYEKNVSNSISYGVDRFEALLKPFGFNGKVPKKTIKTLIELAQIRNLLLHKGGVYDLYIKNKCPWLKYKIGDEVIVDNNKYEKYTIAVSNYLMILLHRIGNYWGADMGDINKIVREEDL